MQQGELLPQLVVGLTAAVGSGGSGCCYRWLQRRRIVIERWKRRRDGADSMGEERERGLGLGLDCGVGI